MSVVSRVTRLGEFSHNGRLCTLGSVLKITEVAQIFGLLVSTCINFEKNGWVTFWAIFSQTRLVTLVASPFDPFSSRA
jgi:hypothetical protein